jgi:ABC-type multidrug transport system fused ATPase/permease subunit
MRRLRLWKTANWLVALIAIILLIVPFQAFITVWLSSLIGHYTALRLWDEVCLGLALLLAAALLLHSRPLRRVFYQWRLVWLILAYAVLVLVCGAVAIVRHQVTSKALGYGLIVDLRFLVFFLVCAVAASSTVWLKRHWRELLFGPAVVVVIFGLFQHFVLSKDFLKHFGYGPDTIRPYQTVNQNNHYVRISSTLRGPNPLGAYLLVILSGLMVYAMKLKKVWPLTAVAVFGIAGLICLFYSYSRSAWVGSVVAVGLVVVIGLSLKKRQYTYIIAGLFGLVIIGAVTTIALRHNSRFEDIIFHTNQNSTVTTSSDQAHESYFRSGLSDVIHQPLGHGPGTAGPASVYNNHPARLAENYFLQIGQETGWLGLVLFIAINWFVGKQLWDKRRDSLALLLLATLIGISLVNMLSYAWTDDSLSYIWWGLAGIMLSPKLPSPKKV